MSAEQVAYWVRSHEGDAYWALGGLYTYKAMAAQVGGDYTAIEVRARGGLAIPVHRHETEAEAFYVADGLVTLFVAGAEVNADPGSFIFVPPGVEHAFRFEAEGRMLLLLTRGIGHEVLFPAIGEPAPSHTVPPLPEVFPDLEEMGRVAAQFGTTIVGPPPV